MSPVIENLPFAANEHETLRQLSYAPLAWETHPIDLAFGSQGWGPFLGPWQHVDFADPASMIDITYDTGNNALDYGPGYDEISLFSDPSIDMVHNTSFLSTLAQAAESAIGGRASTATIANGIQTDAGTGGSAGLTRLRGLLGIGAPNGPA